MPPAVIVIASAFLLADIIFYYIFRLSLKPMLLDWQTWCGKHAQELTALEMLRRFEELLRRNAWLLMLQRMTMIAPLAGVVFTAQGLIGMNLNMGSPDPQLILMSIRPLFWGVGMGAVAAMFQQLIVLPLAMWHVNHQRKLSDKDLPERGVEPAKRVLDDFIQRVHVLTQRMENRLSDVQQTAQQSIVTLDESVQRAADGVGTIVARFDAGASTLAGAAARFDAGITSALGGVSSQLTSAGSVFEAASTAVERQVSGLQASLARSSGDVESASNAFQGALAPIATLAAQAAREINTQAAQDRSIAQQSQAALQEMQRLSQQLREVYQPIAQMAQVMSQTMGAVNDLAARMSHGEQGMASALQTLERSVSAVESGSKALRVQLAAVARETGADHNGRAWWKFWERR